MMSKSDWIGFGSVAAAVVALNFGGFYYQGTRIDGLGTRLDARIDDLDAKIDAAAAKQDARIDDLDRRLARIEGLLEGWSAALLPRPATPVADRATPASQGPVERPDDESGLHPSLRFRASSAPQDSASACSKSASRSSSSSMPVEMRISESSMPMLARRSEPIS